MLLRCDSIDNNPQQIDGATMNYQDYVSMALSRMLNKTQLDVNNIVYTCDETLVPSTGKGIYAMYEDHRVECKPFYVFSGANDADNLFFSPEVNLKYRTIHDYDHAVAYAFGRGTTKYEDELYLNALMSKNVMDTLLICGVPEKIAHQAFYAMYHDTVGQVHYYKRHSTFCDNQRLHTASLLDNCQGFKFASRDQLALSRQIIRNMLKECGL